MDSDTTNINGASNLRINSASPSDNFSVSETVYFATKVFQRCILARNENNALQFYASKPDF